ncbi:MAG: histidinol dehydrogenase [Candidatus Malihini olakiniferum]
MTNRNFDTLIEWEQSSTQEHQQLLTRAAISASYRITHSVNEILYRVKAEGDSALCAYSAQFDKVDVETIRVTPEKISAAVARLGDEIKRAMALSPSAILKHSTMLSVYR